MSHSRPGLSSWRPPGDGRAVADKVRGFAASTVAAGPGLRDSSDAERRHEREDHRRQRRLVRAGRLDEAVEGRWTVVSASRIQVLDNA